MSYVAATAGAVGTAIGLNKLAHVSSPNQTVKKTLVGLERIAKNLEPDEFSLGNLRQ